MMAGAAAKRYPLSDLDDSPTRLNEWDYRGGTGAKRCAYCDNFRGVDRCQVVNGIVSPNGVCRLFTPIKSAPNEKQLREISKIRYAATKKPR